MSGGVGGRDTKKCLDELEASHSLSVSSDGGGKPAPTVHLFFFFLKAFGVLHCRVLSFPNLVFCLRMEISRRSV